MFIFEGISIINLKISFSYVVFVLQSVSEAEINELKQIPELGIDWDKLKPRTQEEITKRNANYTNAKQYNDYKKYYGNKLTFTKQKPITLASLAKELAETEPIDINALAAKGMLFDEIDKIKIKSKEDPIEDEGLFLNEEEDYDPYADEDEAKKLKMKVRQSKDAYDLDSTEHNPYDPENLYTADDQPRTLTDVQFKQIYADEINAYQRMVEKKTDFIDKLESGEADVEDMDKDDMEDVLDDLEDELEDEEIHRTSQEQEFSVTSKRENQFKDDHLKADDLEDVIFKKK